MTDLTDAQAWPEGFSRRQRAEEALRLCAVAGLLPQSLAVRQLTRDARDGMPLQDVRELIHYHAPTEPSTDD